MKKITLTPYQVLDMCAEIADSIADRFDARMGSAQRTQSSAGAGHAIGERSAAQEIARRIRALKRHAPPAPE